MRKNRYRVLANQLRESSSTTLFARKDGTWAAASGGGLSDGDYGDIIVSGSATVFTIDTAVVTYAKFQNVTELSVVGRAGNTSGVAAAWSKSFASWLWPTRLRAWAAYSRLTRTQRRTACTSSKQRTPNASSVRVRTSTGTKAVRLKT